MLKALDEKELRFVQEYLLNLDPKQSALTAGYSASMAASKAYQWVSKGKAKPHVYEAIQKALAERAEKVGIDQQWVLERLTSVTERCLQAEPVFDRKGEHVQVDLDDGSTAKAYTFNAAGANQALGLIGKHLGMFTEKVDLNHGVQNSLAELMQRIDGKSRGLPG